MIESYHYYEQSGLYEDREHVVYQMAPLKYVINPASGLRIDNADILASIDFGYFKTPYMPLSAINSFSVDVGEYSYDRGNGNTGYGLLGCFPNGGPGSLKLLINLERIDSNSDTQNVFLVLNYPITYSSETLASFAPSYCNYSTEVTLTNQNINYDVSAWDKITIGPHVTFTSNRILKAPNIVVLPGAAVPPNVRLQTGLPNGHIPTQVLPATQAEIQTFCASPAYNSQLRNLRKRDDDEEIKEDQGLDKLLTAYPNPADKFVTFQYYLETESEITLKVFDLAGRVVATVADEIQNKGLHEVKYEISNFEAGVYFYTLKTVLGKETKRLVIVR